MKYFRQDPLLALLVGPVPDDSRYGLQIWLVSVTKSSIPQEGC